MRVNYENLIANIDPYHYEETRTNNITTWILEHCYIEKRIDKDTGEIHWKKKQRQIGRSSNRRTVNHYSMVFDHVSKARKDRILTFDEAALLHALIECIEWQDNHVYNELGDRMSIKQFAAYVDKDYRFVLRTLKSLADKHFIRLDMNKHGSSIYVDALYAWRGSIEETSLPFKRKDD